MGRKGKGRADREDAKAIALDLPDVELGSHHGTLDIRVRNKIFATFPPDKKIMVVKCAPENLAALVAREPTVFAPAWGDTWMQVTLEEIDRPTLEQLVVDAWLLAAPPALRKLHAARFQNRS
jgi:hypothetical protein